MMADERVKQLADIIINYSTKVQPGDHVVIRSTPLARPLVEEMYRLIVRNGAHPVLQLRHHPANSSKKTAAFCFWMNEHRGRPRCRGGVHHPTIGR